MSPHVDILDQRERLTPSFFGSIMFHVLLFGAVAALGWVESKTKMLLGDPKGGGGIGSVSITPVSSIPLPAHSGPKNPVATDTESAVPTPVEKAKPSPKVKAPDPTAIPIPSRDAKLRRPTEAATPPDKWRAQQKDLPNQVYSTAGTRVSTQDFAVSGSGSIGVGTSSPFGNQFGAYADLLRNRVAQFWKTTDIRANSAPVVGVTFVLHRDGSTSAIRISQKSGNSALDISAQRAVMDASPFPQMPPGFPKNEAEIEFLFKLKQ